MSSIVVYFSDEEDKKINQLKQKWNLPKYKTIKKMINDFEEKEAIQEAIDKLYVMEGEDQ